jgi:hypothetical protein
MRETYRRDPVVWITVLILALIYLPIATRYLSQ